jgi:hypothetical protein
MFALSADLETGTSRLDWRPDRRRGPVKVRETRRSRAPKILQDKPHGVAHEMPQLAAAWSAVGPDIQI